MDGYAERVDTAERESDAGALPDRDADTEPLGERVERGDALALELTEPPVEAELGTLAVLTALGDAEAEAVAEGSTLTVGDGAEDALPAGESVCVGVAEGSGEAEGEASAVKVPVLQGEGETLDDCVVVAHTEPEGSSEGLAEGDE